MRWRRGFRRILTGSQAWQRQEAPAAALSFSAVCSPRIPCPPYFRYTSLSLSTVTPVEFRAVSKSYAIYDSPGARLTELLSLNRARRHRDFLALENVTFSRAVRTLLNRDRRDVLRKVVRRQAAQAAGEHRKRDLGSRGGEQRNFDVDLPYAH